MKHLLLLATLFLLVSPCRAQKKNGGKLLQVKVVDTPVIDWISYPKDTANVVGTNTQTATVMIRSRLPLSVVEIKINGITTDVYVEKDFSAPVAVNQYEQLVERTITLRTGANTLVIIAKNTQGIYKESTRKVIVDPNQISVLRSSKDNNPPMIYVSEPSNIREDHVVLYEDLIKLTGTVIDESGIQLLKVNGLTVTTRENGAFTIFLPLVVGENPITIEAKDLNQNISLRKFVIDRKNSDGSVYNFANAKNYLLMIGIDQYQSWPALNNAVSDIESIKEVLVKSYRFEPADVITLVNEGATRTNIYTTLRGLIEKISSQDNLLIYFSGHGYFDKLLNEGYWVPVDAPSGSDVSGYIPNSQILKIIENINSQHTFLVADACFSGSLFSTATRGYSDHVEKYKSRWGLASGRLEVVSDGVQGTNSPFAQGFMEFLKYNKDEKVAASDLIQFVKKKVTEANQQTPMGSPLKGVGDEGGEFIFYKRN